MFLPSKRNQVYYRYNNEGRKLLNAQLTVYSKCLQRDTISFLVHVTKPSSKPLGLCNIFWWGGGFVISFPQVLVLPHTAGVFFAIIYMYVLAFSFNRGHLRN